MRAEPLDDVGPRELDRLASSIEIPSHLPWSARAHVFLDVVAVGPDVGYQAVLAMDGGRRDLPVGPVFLDRALASRLLHRLNRDVAPEEGGPPAQLDLHLVSEMRRDPVAIATAPAGSGPDRHHDRTHPA